MMDEIGCTDRRGAAQLPVSIVDCPDPPAAVVGVLRPRVIVARQVVGACSTDEFRMVLAHEGAHIAARDNLKLLLLVAAPDPLAWLPAGRAIAHCWRRAAEVEADQRAAGTDRGRRLALASALIKVARLTTVDRPPGLDLRVAFDDVDGRVQRLLSASGGARRPIAVRLYVACAALVPAVSIPLYASVHRLIEALVAFGR